MRTMYRQLSAILPVALILGCSDEIERMPTATAEGTVTCNGQPVENLRVYFAPMPSGDSALAGKQGMGVTDAQGKFIISTYEDGDGAVVARHNVMIDSPHPEDFPTFNCPCQTDANTSVVQVEVKKDVENKFEIAMSPKARGAKQQPSLSPEDLEDLMDKD